MVCVLGYAREVLSTLEHAASLHRRRRVEQLGLGEVLLRLLVPPYVHSSVRVRPRVSEPRLRNKTWQVCHGLLRLAVLSWVGVKSFVCRKGQSGEEGNDTTPP